MNRTDAHASNLDIILGLDISSPHIAQLLVNRVIDSSAQLRVFIQIGKMRSI